MAPGNSNGLDLGSPMPTDGTATDGICVVCGRRFSNRYYLGTGGGPYCADHVPQPDTKKSAKTTNPNKRPADDPKDLQNQISSKGGN